jgi:MinD superfamily P-loop ATPase
MRKIVFYNLANQLTTINLLASISRLQLNALFLDLDYQNASLKNLIALEDHEKVFSFNDKSNVYILDDECIHCGLCLKICHFEAVERIQQRLEVNQSLCEACDLCRRACPVSAIVPIENQSAFFGEARTSHNPIVYGFWQANIYKESARIAQMFAYANSIISQQSIDYMFISGMEKRWLKSIVHKVEIDLIILLVDLNRIDFREFILFTQELKVMNVHIITLLINVLSDVTQTKLWIDEGLAQQIPTFDYSANYQKWNCQSSKSNFQSWTDNNDSELVIVEIWNNIHQLLKQ